MVIASMTVKVLSDVLDSNRNSFNLIRLVAALSVLVSHSYSMQTGLKASEPLSNLTNFSLGQHAVNAFFVISGLTLAQSLVRTPDLVQFAKARCLRIGPGLFAYGAIFAFVAGPFLTSLRTIDYFTDAHTWFYPVAVMVEFAKATPPPHIFSGVLLSEVVNNPLWTIKYEILAYIGLAILFRLGLFHKTSALILSVAVVLGTLVIVGPAPDIGPVLLNHAARYEFCFLLGVAAHHFSARLPVSPWLLGISAAFAYLSAGSILEGCAYMVLVGHLVLVAGARDYLFLTSFTRKTDLSYGVYIYGWPVQQSLVQIVPGIGVESLIVLSLAVVPLIATASWNLVEKPALRLKHVKTKWLLSRFQPLKAN